MRTRTQIALTAAALAALLAAPVDSSSPAGRALVAPALAQQKGGPTPEELAAEWDKAQERACTESAKKYEGLYKWCNDKKLAWTGITVRRLVLRYDPQNEEVRKFVGYMKAPDGVWLRNDARRDAIREEADIEDPKAQKFPDKLKATNKSVVDIWKNLANKAKKNGETDAANAEAWKTKAASAWERVLQTDSANEEAHKALNHPKYGGRFVRPEAVPFLKVRDERKSGGQKRAQLAVKTQVVDIDGVFKSAGLTGGGAKGEFVTVDTSHGKDVAVRIVQWAERALEDFVVVYGIDADAKNRLPINRLDFVKDKPEIERLSQAGGWPAEKIQQYSKYFGGWQVVAGEFGKITSSGVDADDSAIHQMGHSIGLVMRSMAVQEFGSPSNDMEDWLQETIAYDLSRRLTGTVITQCGDFGKYGMEIEPQVDKDIWIEMARQNVEYDDDVPLSQLWRKKISDQNLRAPEKVKGYAFLQFLFESDPEKARTFVKMAAAQGTPKATLAVFGEGDGPAPDPTMTGPQVEGYGAMEALDAKYREWILKSW
jgi:hypothetical protein